MNKLWMVMFLVLAACAGTDKPLAQPVVMVIGDSVSKQWTPEARRNLCGSVVVQHEAGINWDGPEALPANCENVGQSKSDNNGCAASDLVVALPHLKPWHYSVIMFNAGMHDLQPQKNGRVYHGVKYYCGGPTPIDEYRASIEQLASSLQAHADAVIFVATTPVDSGNQSDISVNSEAAYNAVLKDVAKKHGIYFLIFTGVKPGTHNIHLTLASAQLAGQEAAMCIETALQGSDMENCSR